MADFHHLLGCDGSQMLVAFVVNNCVSLTIVDTGMHHAVILLDYAWELGLQITPAVNSNCGRFRVPGSGIFHDYAGMVEQPFELRLG